LQRAVDPLQGRSIRSSIGAFDGQMHLGRSDARDQGQEFAQVHSGSCRPSKSGALRCLNTGTRAGSHTAMPEEGVNAPLSFLKDLESSAGLTAWHLDRTASTNPPVVGKGVSFNLDMNVGNRRFDRA
jgi:hypothetical protein